MKFGVREICDVVFKAKADVTIGTKFFRKGQPVLYIDSAKTSTIEGAGTTVYATGGKGNARLIAWEGEKTLTFTVEDALLSPIGFSVLSGAGLFDNATESVHVHVTAQAYCDDKGNIDLSEALDTDEDICSTAPIFVITADKDGSLLGDIVAINDFSGGTTLQATSLKSQNVFVDFYVVKESGKEVNELQIDMENFAGNYYVEASTLFRRQYDGVDLPAEITFPNVKIQSNFTFTMSSSGDPSTFTFTMDALPGYTYFNPNKKLLCAIQIIGDSIKTQANGSSVFSHADENDYTDEDLLSKDSNGFVTE